MRILYLIGNGFDINVGLHTSYSEFLQDYLQQEPTTELDLVGKRFINRLKSELNFVL